VAERTPLLRADLAQPFPHPCRLGLGTRLVRSASHILMIGRRFPIVLMLEPAALPATSPALAGGRIRE